MFDTFDILVPKLLPCPSVDIRQQERAFGVDEDRYVYVRDIKLGKVLLASVAFSAIEAWTGSPDRADWTILLLHAEANAAAQHDGIWEVYLEAVLTVLRSHSVWRVTCESDCDQHPVARLEFTPDALVAVLDDYRNNHHYPISFYSEAAAPHA